jgi:hypothetical protein
MRDIRSDLEERANLCQEQIKAANSHFEAIIQRVQRDRDKRIADLQSLLAMVQRFIEFENSRMGNVVPLENPAPAAQPAIIDRIRAVNAS